METPVLESTKARTLNTWDKGENKTQPFCKQTEQFPTLGSKVRETLYSHGNKGTAPSVRKTKEEFSAYRRWEKNIQPSGRWRRNTQTLREQRCKTPVLEKNKRKKIISC